MIVVVSRQSTAASVIDVDTTNFGSVLRAVPIWFWGSVTADQYGYINWYVVRPSRKASALATQSCSTMRPMSWSAYGTSHPPRANPPLVSSAAQIGRAHV